VSSNRSAKTLSVVLGAFREAAKNANTKELDSIESDLLYSSSAVKTTVILIAALTLEAGLLGWPRFASHQEISTRIQQVYVANSIAYLPYLIAIYWLGLQGRSTGWEKFVLLSGLVLRLGFYFAHPLLSDDLARYRWEAQLWESGGNPYFSTPRDTGVDTATTPGPDARSVYGPWLMLANWAAWKVGQSKLSGALGELLLMCAVWIWSRRQHLPQWRFAAYAWCPLVIVECWQEGHADSWLVLFLFTSLALIAGGRLFPAWLFWMLSILTKWWPALLLPWYLRLAWNWTGALILALAGTAFVVLPGLEFWTERFRFTTGFLGGWSNNAYLARLLTNKWQALGIICLGAATLPWWRNAPMRVALYFSTFLLAFSANIHPWYLVWFLPFACVAAGRISPWLLTCALSPLFYEAVPRWKLLGIWEEDGLLRIWIWSAVSLFSIFLAFEEYFIRHRARSR
jgi:hypothetical protein